MELRNLSPTNLARLPAGFAFVALASAILAGFGGCQKAESKAPPPPAQEVLYVTPIHQTVMEYEEFTGRTWARNTVDVRARVSGYLDEIGFEDGALVKAGDLLFEIDDRTYKAELARAEASIAQYEARIDRLTKQERRARPLTQTNTVTQEEYETIVADKHEAEASLEGAKADTRIAKLNLDYTQVKAPISGRISRHLIDKGNLVTADSSILATIVTIDPIYVYFDVDERTVLRLQRIQRLLEKGSASESKVEVQIALADEQEFKHRGTVNFVDNQIDPATGTLRYRAEIDNADRFFTPGLFARLRFPIGEPQQNALLVPEEALATDQGQRFVFVIVKGTNKDNKPVELVEYRRVDTGTLVDGLRVIKKGVEPEDRVVVTGLQRIRKGSEVIPRPRPASAEKVAASNHAS